MSILRPVAAAFLVLLTVGACADGDPAAPEGAAPALVSVVPQGGATDVDPAAHVVLQFDHPLMPGMETYADVHEHDVTGPEVEGAWSVESQGTRLTFMPDQPLMPHTEHVVHVGGGMTGPEGLPIDLERHGPGLGGHWATDGMMGGGPGSGGMGGGMGAHMGDGWRHPDNGSWGMVFTFTTGDGS